MKRLIILLLIVGCGVVDPDVYGCTIQEVKIVNESWDPIPITSTD